MWCYLVILSSWDRIASKLGLELSYLERLMQRPVYDLKTCSGQR
jgi:hypothetical protein